MLPQVDPGEPRRVEHVDDPDLRWALFNQIVERSCQTTFFAWQTFLVPDDAAMFRSLSEMRPAIERLPVVRVSGTIGARLDLGDLVAVSAGS